MYNHSCERCNKEMREEEKEFVWRPEWDALCEDCYLFMIEQEEQYVS